MKFSRVPIFFVLLTICTTLAAQQKTEKDEEKSKSFQGLKFRAIGPALVSGRVIDLAVNPQNPDEFYVAAASGGVWKTENHGTTFSPVFDSYGSYSIGCVTIDPSNTNIVWVGTGENNNQRSVGYGDGIYKSIDGGKSFKNCGLKNSEHISKIIVHPQNSNQVYVAAYGPLWSDGGERGVYMTTDGGETWNRVLHVSDKTGISDLWMDPRDPEVLYATAHQRRRHVWTYLSGGPESAIYKSTDGGKNWRKVNKGLPDGDLGRIALAISPSDPDVVYAMVEGFDKDHGGFYRSTNRGESWEKQSDYFTSGNYYVELVPHPTDECTVFSMDTWLHHTENCGKSFVKTGEKSKHVDNHAMWINPTNTDHWLVGCDGGLYETWDAGKNWKFFTNLNITQFYRVAVDNDQPFYNVYGGTQDNNTIGGPSRTTNVHGITNYDWYITRGGDGFEPQIDPTDPNIVYSQAQYGWLVRYNRKTGERVNIKPIERKGEAPYRWNWDAPFIISPHDSKTLYFAANKVFRSTDRGNSWEVISDDLTRQIDRNKLKVMGTTWGPDAVAYHQSTSIYGNIVSLSESPVKQGLLYAGTDDGLIHVSEDGGKNWRKISAFPGVPDRTYVIDLQADKFNENTVYAAFNNHKNGDFKPYILKSNDKGKSWQPMHGNLPERGSVYCLRQDFKSPGLFFTGTEFGAYFSPDAGKNWYRLKEGLPTIAIRDMEIQQRENDLVLASFGRGFFVLDDFAPLRALNDTTGKRAHIFAIKDALLYQPTNPLGTKGKGSQGESFFTAPNPPFGARIRFYLASKPKSLKEQRRSTEKKLRKSGKDVTYPEYAYLREEDEERSPYMLVEIKDADGAVVQRYVEKNVKKGINETVWDLRTETTSPVRLKESDGGRYGLPDYGPLATPGTYSVSLYLYLKGELTPIAGPEPFVVKPIHEDQLFKPESEELIAFNKRVLSLRRDVSAAAELVKHLDNKISHMHEAVMKTPGAPASLIEKIEDHRLALQNIKYQLHGESYLKKREAPAYPGIQERVEIVVYDMKSHTEAPTQTAIRSIEIAAEEFETAKQALDNLNAQIEQTAAELKKAGAPYFPE
ncbi:MAG: hypothetical protein Kow0075_07730 [Salibacteraceae bacterium]